MPEPTHGRGEPPPGRGDYATEFKYYICIYDYACLDKAVHQSHTQGQGAFSLRQHQRRPRDRATRDMEHDGGMHGPVLRVLRLLS